jgi:multidrug efflux system membrane fusion protein
MSRIIRSPWVLAVAIAIAVTAWMASGLIGSDATPAATTSGASGADAADVTAARTPSQRPPVVQVSREPPQLVQRELEISGRTEPARRVMLKAATVGTVVEVVAPRGARVNEGEVLLRLDVSDREARMTQAEASVRQRELEYRAQAELAPGGYITEARVAEALALLEAARAERERAKLDLERMVVRAPFDGVVLEREIELGDYVTPGDPLLSFLDDRTIIVAGDVAESNIASVALGDTADARLVDGATHSGTVRYIAPLANTTTRTFLVELALDNTKGRIPLGATARLRLPLEAVEAWPISPALLALDDAGDIGVKIVDDEQRVQFVNVDVVRSDADTVWIAGLPSPATIITRGQGFVTDGQRVEIRLDAAQTPTDERETATLGGGLVDARPTP